MSVFWSVCLYVCLFVRGQRVDDFKSSEVNVCLLVCLSVCLADYLCLSVRGQRVDKFK